MIKKRGVWGLLAGGFVVATWMLGGPAFSQDTATGQGGTAQTAAADQGPTASDAAQNGANAGALQEVVVTAERRAVDVQETPIVVSAMSGQELLEAHLQTYNDLQVTAPAFVDDATGGGFTQNLNIRGIGTTATSAPAILPGITTYHDGVLQGEVTGLDVPFFDIADTEVLEGPQGTLGGGSSVGGAIQINTANPNFRGVNGFVESQIGSYSDEKMDGAVNLPVSDTLAFRFAFNEENKNSFYRNDGAIVLAGPVRPITDPGRTDNLDMRLSMLWKPTDNFQALAKYEYNLLDFGGEAAEPIPTPYTTLFNGASCTNTGPNGSIICPGAGVQVHNPFWYPGEQPLVLNYDSTQDEYRDYVFQYTLELRYTLPGAIVLRSLSGFLHDDTDLIFPQSYGPLNDGVNWHELGPGNDAYSEEIDLISPTAGKINWIAGAFAYDRLSPVNVVGPVYLAPYSASENPTSESVASDGSVVRTGSVFGNVNWQFLPTMQLQVGLRENWDNNYNFTDAGSGVYKYPNFPGNLLPGTPATGYDYCPPLGGSLTSCVVDEGHFSDSVPTGKVDLNWTPAAGQNFYVFFAKGYKSGSPNGNPNTVNPTFQPEKINDYEIGWKGQLLNNHILTQIGGYWMEYIDMQFPIYNFYTPSTGGSDDVNLAPSTSKGIEVSMQSRLGRLEFNFGFDYNVSTLGTISALNSAALPGNTPYGFGTAAAPAQCPPSGPIPGCFNYLPYVQNFSGEPNAFAPKITTNEVLDYNFPLGENTLQPRVTFSYMSSQYASLFDTPYYYIPPRTLVGANLDYEAGSWLLELYGTNLADRIFVQSNDGSHVYYGAPRQWGVRAEYTIGGH